MAFKVIFVPIIAFLLLKLTFAIDTKENVRNSGRSIRRREKDDPFPRIYNATIVKSNNMKFFASQVDLIQFNGNDHNESYNISFLVHDVEELTHLKSMATMPLMNVVNKSIHFDLKATMNLHQQINYVGPKVKSSSGYSKIPDYPCYKDLKGSFDWMDAMVNRSKSIPGLNVSKKDIGDSWLKQQNPSKGYDIWVLKVTGKSLKKSSMPSSSSINSDTFPKAVIFIMTGLHAREFAPTELASRWVESMISGYGKDADITAILDVTEIHLVLQSNPDGRQVVERDRASFRRKNMNSGSLSCDSYNQGVDLNRNFPFRWGLDSGSSSDECSETFRGKTATSSGVTTESKSICTREITLFRK
jgi:hypothetical protein